MYTIFSWIMIAIESLFIGFLVFMAIKKRKITLSENAWYFVPSILILYALYATDLIYTASVTGEALSIYAFINVIKYCLDVFKPEISYEGNLLLATNSVYSIAFLIAIVLALAVFITFAINVIYYFLYSKIRIRKILKNGCDVVLGDDDDAKVYIQSYPNSILFLQEQPTKEQKKLLREKGIVYIVLGLRTPSLISRFGKYVNNDKEYNFVCLKEHEWTLRAVAIFKAFILQTKCENFFLHVEFDYKNYKSLNEVILENENYTAFINCFNKHELMARKFVQENPITKFVPSEFFDYGRGIVKQDKNINVFYLGFGRVASALFDASLMNDKLVTEKDKKLTEMLVNYYIYDKEGYKSESKNRAFYNDRYFSNNYKKDEYFEPIQKGYNVIYNCLDIEHSDGVKDYQAKLIECKEEFSNIVIALGSDVENIDTAIKTVMFMRQNDLENYHLFVRLKSGNKEYHDLFDNNRVTFFGADTFTINHSVIVDEVLIKRAKTLNSFYEAKRQAKIEWAKLSLIKKLSNVYSGLNLRLKLNLLGYDLDINNGENYDGRLNAELISRLEEQTPSPSSPYVDFLFFNKKGFNSANALSYQEKLRWNAFYIANGYALMKKMDIKVVSSDKVVKDDDRKKLHGCLTTVEGLDEYHRFVAEGLSKASGRTIEEELDNVNTYKYDYSVLDVIKSFNENSPMVIVKR